jgi:hypothetical protein
MTSEIRQGRELTRIDQREDVQVGLNGDLHTMLLCCTEEVLQSAWSLV